MNISNENGIVKIIFEGKVDSSNASGMEETIWAEVDFSACTRIIIDAEKLEMISSAGLRLILRMRKRCPDVSVIEVNPDVYEVFDITGFTEMLNVEKAYRKLSVEGCEILGEGSNGIVYRYDPEIVVKVYRNAEALSAIERERRLARKALVLGIPTAIPFDVVKVENTYGSVFELLNAKSFSKLIDSEPDKTDEYISMFIELLKKIHSTTVDHDELEDMKQVALDWAIYLSDHLPQAQSEKLISLIKAVPERSTMIHGDYHTNNVQMQDGEVLLIDMDTLSFGHPVFELASMFLGFVGFGELDPSVVFRFMKLPYDKTTYIWRKSLELYLNTTDESIIRDVEDKAKIIGYARLLRRTLKRVGYTDPSGATVIDYCKAKLEKLLAEVDSLDF